jgi:uncharacterized protein
MTALTGFSAQGCATPAKAHLYSLVVKVTSGCNLACSYCYIAAHNASIGSRRIDDRVIRSAIESYAQIASAGRGTCHEHNGACFLWHGGEPTLAGRDFFYECFDHQKRCFGDLSRVRNCITTNGVLIDDAWITLFHDYGVDVSVSIDGPPAIHDRYRPRRGGGCSFEAAHRAYLHLRGAGLDPGIMMVVTEAASADPDGVYDFFRGLGAANLSFVPHVTRDDYVSADSYYRFLERFFDRWLQDDRPDFYVRDFDTIITRLFGGRSTLCEYNNCCGNYLALDVDGSVYSCDLFIGQPDYRVGNLPEDNFDLILEGKALARHIAVAQSLPSICQECAYNSLCGGGCLYRRQLAPDGVDPYCSSRMRIVDHIVSAVNAATTTNRSGA